MAAGLVAWLFYESVWGLLLLPAGIYLFRMSYLEWKRQKEEEAFLMEYKELLLSVSTAIQAGYSVERAFREAEGEMSRLCKKESACLAGLRSLNHKVELSIPIEKAFLEFAKTYPYEDVVSFGQIFRFGKRLGGDYNKNIRATAVKLEEKIRLRQEIASITAEKRLEMNLMSLMPLLILLYIRLTSYSFIEPLYHNLLGILVMSGGLMVYGLAVYLGRRIVRIAI